MSNLVKRKSNRRKSKRSPIILLLVILTWSLVMGWVLALATNAQTPPASASVGTVDVVPSRYQLGQELYLENCATCHLALPPSVLPTQTWQQILQDPQHYGVQLPPLIDPPRLLMWNYLQTYSRPVIAEEQTPYRVNDSRLFKALHPKIKLQRPVQISSCVTCHPSAADYNFRRLTPEWESQE